MLEVEIFKNPHPGLHWEIEYQWAYRILTAVLELRFFFPSTQAFCLLVLDLVMLGVILKKEPFENPYDQRLQKSLQCALIALTAVGILCLYGVLDDGVAKVLVVGLFSVKVAAVSIKLCGQWGARRRTTTKDRWKIRRLRRRDDDDER